jgi:light-regulated signal transduction histidine kinase (bacteriophytochrome)
LEKKSEDLNILVKNVLFNLKEQIEETHAEIEIDQLPIALINQIQLGQVFQNLIGNAIKFHGEGIPKIKIFSVRKHSEWIISVKDNGIGIEKQYFDRIFVLFQRLHTRTEYQGTGIGLSVCKKIVERHGGKIWVESNPGNGTIFNFSIPDKFQTELTQTKFLPYVQQNREIRQ